MYDSDAANLYSPVLLHSERLVSALYWKNAHEYMVCSAPNRRVIGRRGRGWLLFTCNKNEAIFYSSFTDDHKLA